MSDYQKSQTIKKADDVLKTNTVDGSNRIILIEWRSATVENRYYVKEVYTYVGAATIPATMQRGVYLI